MVSYYRPIVTLCLQESLADAKVARDSSACMKTPSEEIYTTANLQLIFTRATLC